MHSDTDTNRRGPRAVQRGKTSVAPVAFFIASVAAIIMLMLSGATASIMFALVIVTAILLVRATLTYGRRGEWQRVVGELATPWTLWILFGLGGLIVIWWRESVANYFVPYVGSSVIWMSVYALLGAITYIACFRLSYGSRTGRRLLSVPVPASRVALLCALLLLVDWYVRVTQIRNGVYFTWVMAEGASQFQLRTGSLLAHFQLVIAPLTITLLVYQFVRARGRTALIVVSVLTVQGMLILSQGSRRHMVVALIVGVIVYARGTARELGPRFIAKCTVAGLVFFLVLGPMVTGARLLMRQDTASLLEDPGSIPRRFVFEYLPKGFGASGASPALHGRVGSYMSYAASIHHVRTNTYLHMNREDLYGQLGLVVPRIIYAEKRFIDADALLASRLRVGRRGTDAAGTVVADVFAYLHVWGVVGLLAIGGLAFGFVSRYLLVRFGLAGEALFVGLLPQFILTGDAFAEYLVGIRNVVLLLLGITVVWTRSIRSQAPTKRK